MNETFSKIDDVDSTQDKSDAEVEGHDDNVNVIIFIPTSGNASDILE